MYPAAASVVLAARLVLEAATIMVDLFGVWCLLLVVASLSAKIMTVWVLNDAYVPARSV